MFRLILLLAIAVLVWLGLRSLLTGLRGNAPRKPEAVADLRACTRCGTFVEPQLLDAQYVCPDCRDAA